MTSVSPVIMWSKQRQASTGVNFVTQLHHILSGNSRSLWLFTGLKLACSPSVHRVCIHYLRMVSSLCGSYCCKRMKLDMFVSRLPILQGGTFTLLAPSMAMLSMPEWTCPAWTQNASLVNSTSPEFTEMWQMRMRAVSVQILQV